MTSAGRQYAQLCDLYVLVAIIQDWQRAGRVMIDWEMVLTGRVVRELARWPLPGGHTGAPNRTKGQVGGVYQFWWAGFRDVFRNRYFGTRLPTDEALDRRMEACGVPLYTTSSSSFEEMCAIHTAFAVYRDDPDTARASAAELVRLCLRPRLAGELHWQTYRRPRHRTDRGQAAPDGHESGLRSTILEAAARPEDERTPYDEFFLLLRAALDELVDDAERSELARLYWRAVAAYNANHPGDEVKLLHR